MVPQSGLVLKSQLWQITATYLATDQPDAIVELVVTDRISNLPFITASSSPVKLMQGVQVFSEATLGPITYTYTAPGNNWETTGMLPVGLYQFCYRVITVSQKNVLEEMCIETDVEAMSPPMLTYPEDSALLETQYPQFVWLPPAPVTIFPNLKYDLLAVEILPGQTAQEAVQRNMPFYSAAGLTENMHVYQSTFSNLDTGRYYAWQVTSRNGDTYGAKTEVWVFKITHPNPLPNMNGAVFYPRLTKSIYDAVLFLGESPVRFEFINELNEMNATISLVSSEAKGQVIDTKQIKILAGENKINWDASLPARKTSEQLVVLTLNLPSGQRWGCVFRIPAKSNH